MECKDQALNAVAGWMRQGCEMFVNSSIVLISAVLASLAVGVLLAYGVCVAMFGIFRAHAQQVAAESRRVGTPAQVARG
jgi:hypothetical protein